MLSKITIKITQHARKHTQTHPEEGKKGRLIKMTQVFKHSIVIPIQY